jgi:hypothetical protein
MTTDDKGNQWMIRCKDSSWLYEIGRVHTDTMDDLQGVVRRPTQMPLACHTSVKLLAPEATNCVSRSRAGPAFLGTGAIQLHDAGEPRRSHQRRL